MDIRKDWDLIYRVVLVGLSISAFIYDFFTYGAPDFRYFTDESNLGVLIWLILAILCRNNANLTQKLKGFFRGAVTLYITVTFLIYSTLLAAGPQEYSSLIFHYILPIAFIFEWVLTEFDKKYRWQYMGPWLIYPLIYLGGVVINGNLTGFYPYFFLDLSYLGVGSFIINVLLLVVLFAGLGLVYIGVNRAILKHQAKTGKSPQ